MKSDALYIACYNWFPFVNFALFFLLWSYHWLELYVISIFCMVFCSCCGHTVIFVSGCIIPCMLCGQIIYGVHLFLCNNNTYLVIGVDLLGLYTASKVIVPLFREFYEVHCLKQGKCIQL
jgi:hypothetical protein